MKKEFPMGRKKEQEELELNNSVEPESEISQSVSTQSQDPNGNVLYTHESLGIFKDMKTGEWKVACIKFNPDTSEAKMYDVITCGYKDFAIERFKIESSKRVMRNER
jgi:hypothetical protein